MIPTSPNWFCTKSGDVNSTGNIISKLIVKIEGIFCFASKNDITLLSLDTKHVIGILEGHTNRVRSVEFVKLQQQFCVSGGNFVNQTFMFNFEGDDQKVICWDISSQKEFSSHTLHKVLKI